MEIFSCLIIDDEPSAINILKHNVEAIYSNIEVKGTYTQWSKAIEAIRANDVDLLFLDINMQGKNGMDLLKMVPDLKAEVIFVTAYTEYALAALQLQAAGYLLKPVDEAQMIVTIDKTLERIRNKRLALKSIEKSPFIRNKVGIPTANMIEYINIDDVIYCESVNSYTKVFTIDNTIVCSYNIGKFKTAFDSGIFFQSHRSFIVNLNHVKRYNTSGTIIMDNEAEIPLARNLRETFLNQFDRIKGKM